jgi:hypothetical protein
MTDRADPISPLPTVDLAPSEDQQVTVLRDLQAVVLKHPVAAQAAFEALAAEGRRFARTPEGERWRARLAGSELIDRVRLVFETSTLWMLEHASPGVLPSGYVDALFTAASQPGMEPLLDRLFPGSPDDDGHED